MALYDRNRLIRHAGSLEVTGILIAIAYTAAFFFGYVAIRAFFAAFGAVATGFHLGLHHAVPPQPGQPVHVDPVSFIGPVFWGIIGFAIGYSKAQAKFVEAQKILCMVEQERNLELIYRELLKEKWPTTPTARLSGTPPPYPKRLE